LNNRLIRAWLGGLASLLVGELAMALNKYIAQIQRFCRDQKQQYLDLGNLTDYVNQARREIAMRAQCIRVLPPISGAITAWTVTNGGHGYSATPVLTISPPDFPGGGTILPLGKQATAVPTVLGGVITSIANTYGGSGYFNPQMIITDTTGVGATAVPTLSPMNLLFGGQEQYLFSDINLAVFPGIKEIYNVHSVSIIYANYRYSLPCYAFSVYQAMVRQFPFQYEYVPTFFSQFGQGAAGSLFFYPLPSQTYQMEWDCRCLPLDLIDDQSLEIVPDPWTDAVPYFAAKLAFEELQNLNAAKYYEAQFAQRCLGYSQYARVGRAINMYGRY
jgi:hypothetical protein